MTSTRRLDREERYDGLLRLEGQALRRVAAVYERVAGRREDLFQEICLAVWQALPKFEGRSSERTFVFRIAHNRGLTWRWRAGRTAQTSLDEAAEPEDPAPGPEAAATSDQRSAQLRRAVARLPLKHRQVITLTLEGLTQAEIGEVVGISANNVAVRVSRARGMLRDLLEARRRGS